MHLRTGQLHRGTRNNLPDELDGVIVAVEGPALHPSLHSIHHCPQRPLAHHFIDAFLVRDIPT